MILVGTVALCLNIKRVSRSRHGHCRRVRNSRAPSGHPLVLTANPFGPYSLTGLPRIPFENVSVITRIDQFAMQTFRFFHVF